MDLHCSYMPAKITEVYDVATKIALCGSSTLGSDSTLKMEGIEAQSWRAKQPKSKKQHRLTDSTEFLAFD